MYTLHGHWQVSFQCVFRVEPNSQFCLWVGWCAKGLLWHHLFLKMKGLVDTAILQHPWILISGYKNFCMAPTFTNCANSKRAACTSHSVICSKQRVKICPTPESSDADSSLNSYLMCGQLSCYDLLLKTEAKTSFTTTDRERRPWRKGERAFSLWWVYLSWLWFNQTSEL